MYEQINSDNINNNKQMEAFSNIKKFILMCLCGVYVCSCSCSW